ncbi:hypothetical protein C8A05DRAFT_45003 [Staphylotrichum tortipilum]|uniref:Glycosyl transferase n=1 Tax=Staphylotrichum tortipilum TaxID=2831512 RepID=A0AAN6MJH3_9PEZI|nr:hypothetical protein C8A05DRAFT_45003 [Staphylotrichum longicolle]
MALPFSVLTRGSPRVVVVGVAAFFLLLLASGHTSSYLPTWPAARVTNSSSKNAIPNQVHFVYVLDDPTKDFTFQFSQFLSVYAANYYWRPQTIYLHTNVPADSQTVARARSGAAGKWTRLIFTHFPNLQLRTIAVPTHADNGVGLHYLEHRSDFVRVAVVYELGGVYIDFDVHALRDIRVLRESGFRGVAGRQSGGELNSGTFMAVKGARMMQLWKERMHQVYDREWTTHSNIALTTVGERLVREEGEMLIMDQDAFAPGGSGEQDNMMLFAVRDGTVSNLEGVVQGDALGIFDEAFDERWAHPQRFPEGVRDWSTTYMVHAFSPHRFPERKIPGYEHITPRYVLARQSNFARAVYPMAQMMYEQGLIEIDDSYLGM